MASERPKPQHQLLNVPMVQEQLQKAVDYAANEFREFCIRDIGSQVDEEDLESPIEAVFLVWFHALVALGDAVPLPWTRVHCSPQLTVDCAGRTYRLDFCIQPDPDLLFDAQKAGISIPAIAVELDGHDWHERTKEQVIDRNRRDRDLQAAGWKVFHFSGTELLRDPVACVEQVLGFASGAFWALQRALRNQQG